MGGAHLVQGRCRFGVVADGAGHARPIDFRRQGRRDADQADRFAGLGERFGERQDIRMDAAARAFNGKIREVLGRAETAGHDQGVEVLGIGLTQILDVAAGNARRFHQNVARFGHFLTGQVVEHMHLRNVRRKALHLGAALVEAQQGDHALVDFGAVKDTTAGKDHCNFFFGHAHYSRVEALDRL
ncbi:hypothetical protein D3C84_757930 [compost metagenome]